jgi:hypothetical protein
MGTGYHRLVYDPQGQRIGHGYTTSLNRYAEGDHRERMETAAARAALRVLADSARRIATDLSAAIEPLTQGRWTIRPDEKTGFLVHEQILGHWEPSACGCCNDETWLP